jgi:hypothetical protein
MISIPPQSVLVAGPGGPWLIHTAWLRANVGPGTSVERVRRTSGGLQIVTVPLELGEGFLAFDGNAVLLRRADGVVQRRSVNGLLQSPALVRPTAHCGVTRPVRLNRADFLSRSLGRSGQDVVVTGPTLRTEDGRYAPASFVEVVWNTNVAVSAVPDAAPITPGPVFLLAREPILGQCRFRVSFRVPDVPPGRYRITVLIWHEPPGDGYGLAGVETFRVTR